MSHRGPSYVPIESPLDIPGVMAYWSGKEAVAEGYAPGASLSQLIDYSGNLNHWNQANAANQGTWQPNLWNGWGCVRLDVQDGYVGTYDPGAQPKAGTMAVLHARTTEITNSTGILIAGSYDGAGTACYWRDVRESAPAREGSWLLSGAAQYVHNDGCTVGQLRGNINAHSVTHAKTMVNGFLTRPASATVLTPRIVDLGYSINTGAGAEVLNIKTDIVEIVVWGRELTTDEMEDLSIFWHLTFLMPYGFNELFTNSASKTVLHGYKTENTASEGTGSIHLLGGDYLSSGWSVVDHDLKIMVDTAESYADGTEMDELVSAGLGATLQATGTTHDIYNRQFGGVDDHRFRLNEAIVAWEMPWGTDWDHVRLTLALSCTDAGSGPALGDWFAYGICKGTDVEHFGSHHVFGLFVDSTEAWTSYSAGAYYRANMYSGKIEGGGITQIAVNPSATYFRIIGGTNMTGMSVDITKGGNFTLKCVPPHSSCYGPAALLEIDDDGALAPAQTGYSASRYAPVAANWLNDAIPIDEGTYGEFDSFFIAWVSGHFNIEISSIITKRLF